MLKSKQKTKPSIYRKLFKWMILSLLSIVILLVVFLSIRTPVTTNVDKYVYDLPFATGSKYRIVQGYGGLFSHKNIAAIDFDMPVGTPIHAAREGIIYGYKDDSNVGGPFTGYKNKANYIIIKHSDGSFGCYWHLQFHGVLVKDGVVAKGQIIGYSGNTGFIFKPHLHFSVKKKFGYDKDYFVKTKFRTTKGVEFLEMWDAYEHTVE